MRVYQDEVEDISLFTALMAPCVWNPGNAIVIKHLLGTRGLLDVDIQSGRLHGLEAQDPNVVLAHLPGDLRRDDRGAFLQLLARAGRSQDGRGARTCSRCRPTSRMNHGRGRASRSTS